MNNKEPQDSLDNLVHIKDFLNNKLRKLQKRYEELAKENKELREQIGRELGKGASKEL